MVAFKNMNLPRTKHNIFYYCDTGNNLEMLLVFGGETSEKRITCSCEKYDF